MFKIHYIVILMSSVLKYANSNVQYDTNISSGSGTETAGEVKMAALNGLADHVSATQIGSPWETEHRLPKDVTVVSYDLLLHPNLEDGTFCGSVKIILRLIEPRHYLLVHSDCLIITDPQVLYHECNSSKPKIRSAFEFPKNEFFVIVLNHEIPQGLYELHLKFKGLLTKNIIGFYRSSYNDITTGITRQIATSKFEPTYARQAFPCLDEPGFKANFTIRLVRPTGNSYIALSNMNQEKEEVDRPSAGLTTVHFATTVPMSTYLACFIVCDFERLEPALTQGSLPVSVYARPGQTEHMHYARDLATKTIDYYVQYFGIDYPLPKLDLIAIPDFVSGAMEHWGLVTFRETSVLYHEGVSSSANKKQVGLTVAHELAHMWFGNLVTMEWWNDLWLNEGFASFMEFKGVANYHPDWDVDTQFLIEDLQNVLSLDSAFSSHPIVQNVSHPDQITEIFDTISYSKGASVIRMLENVMGEEAFRKGVSAYLKQFAYKNACTADLWAALQAQSQHTDIAHLMDTWTRQMGFPLVTIARDGDVMTLTQQRFLADKTAAYNRAESPFQYTWDIPISFTTSADPKMVHTSMFFSNQTSVSIPLPKSVSWVKLNHHQYGYYRVQYAPQDWTALTELLKTDFNAVDAADRAQLLDDAFSLAEAGYSAYETAISMTQYLTEEHHFVPWAVASSKLKALKAHLKTTPVYANYQNYVRNILQPTVTESMWIISPTSSYLERRRQLTCLSLACSMGLTTCVQKAQQLFRAWLNTNGTKPHPELRGLVYYHGMADGGSEEDWDRLWQLFVAENEPQEKAKMRQALCAVKEPWLLSRMIELSKNESYVRSQDFLLVLNGIADNPVGNAVVWDFVRDQWDYLLSRFTLNSRLLGRIVPRVTENFASVTKLSEVKAFFQRYPEAGAGAAGRKQAIENIGNNIKWLETHLEPLTAWLDEENCGVCRL